MHKWHFFKSAFLGTLRHPIEVNCFLTDFQTVAQKIYYQNRKQYSITWHLCLLIFTNSALAIKGKHTAATNNTMTAKPRAEVGSTTVYYITAQGGKKETSSFSHNFMKTLMWIQRISELVFVKLCWLYNR